MNFFCRLIIIFPIFCHSEIFDEMEGKSGTHTHTQTHSFHGLSRTHSRKKIKIKYQRRKSSNDERNNGKMAFNFHTVYSAFFLSSLSRASHFYSQNGTLSLIMIKWMNYMNGIRSHVYFVDLCYHYACAFSRSTLGSYRRQSCVWLVAFICAHIISQNRFSIDFYFFCCQFRCETLSTLDEIENVWKCLIFPFTQFSNLRWIFE